MQGYTLQQLQAMGAKPVGPPAPVGLTAAQLQAQGAQPVAADPVSVYPGASATPSMPNPIDAMKAAAAQGAQQVSEAASEIGNGEGVIPAVESGLKAGSGIASVATSPLAAVFAPFGKIIQDIANKVSDIHSVQDFATSDAGKVTARAAGDLANAGNIAGTILGADQAVKAVPKAVAGVKNAVAAVDAAVPNGGAGGATVSSVIPTTPEAAINAAKTDWQRAIETAGPRFNKARAVAAQNPDLDIPNFLATHDIAPYDHVDDDIYSTEDTADKLRASAGEISRSSLRPSLQMADYNTAPTPVSEITNTATKDLKSFPQLTADDSENINDLITKKTEALERKYPDGMSLTNMHDEKITYAANGGYKPMASAADNNSAIANRIMGGTLGRMVEEKAPSDLPVGEFNKSLSQYYKAADYLDALNGKRAPVSPVQQIIRYAARAGGALAASHLPGGNLVGDFIGYQLGKYAEMQLENMTGPMRAMYLKNLKITNPAAFDQVTEFLNKNTAGASATEQPASKP